MLRQLFFTILVFMLCLAQPDGDEHIGSEHSKTALTE